MENSTRGIVTSCIALCMLFAPSLGFAQIDKPNAPGVGVPIPATQVGSPMSLAAGEYSPLTGGPVKYVDSSKYAQMNTVTWTESFCSDLISKPTVDAGLIQEAIGFENFPPGTVIRDLDVSVDMNPAHSWLGDVSIGFGAAPCGSPGSVAGCSSILFDGDGGDGGIDVDATCTSSSDLGSVTFDDSSTTTYAADCTDDGIVNNSTGNLPEGPAGALSGWEGTSPEDMLYWLIVADDAGGDEGVLEGWCMTMELEAPIPDCSASMTTVDAPVCPDIVSDTNLGRGGSVIGGDLQIDFSWEFENSGMIDFGFDVDNFVGSTIGFPNDASLFATGCETGEFDTSQAGTEQGSCSVSVPSPEVPECGVTELVLGGWTAPAIDVQYSLPPTFYIPDENGATVAFPVVGGADAFAATCATDAMDIPAVTCTVQVHPQCIILPVELSNLESSIENGNLVVRWQTATELNNAGFDVEIKSSISDFESQGFVEGAGDSVTEKSYEFILSDLTPGDYLIRLKQIDFDGTFKYSNEIEASIEVAGKYFLGDAYPNPFNPSAIVEFAVPDEQFVRVSLHDLSGREVQSLFEGELGSDEIKTARIDGKDLASGVYVLRINGNSFVGTKMLVLQK